MLKKNYVPNADYQILLKKDLRGFQYLQSLAGRQNFIKNITAVIATTSGIMQAIILSVCLI